MQILSILNFLNFALPLIWLIAILIYWFRFGEVNIKWIKAAIFSVVVFFAVTGAYSTVATYNLWKIDPLSRYLLPPYSPIGYFYGYAFFHYWQRYGIIIMLSLVWAFTLWAINRYSQGRFLEREDIYLGFFTGMVVGWPNFISFVAIFFGLMIGRQIVNIIIFKKNEAVQVVPYLIIGAIIALFAGSFLINKLSLGVLKI